MLVELSVVEQRYQAVLAMTSPACLPPQAMRASRRRPPRWPQV